MFSALSQAFFYAEKRKEVVNIAVFRVERTGDYTVMANHHLRNRSLSLKAKGLLSQMLSLPENWDYVLIIEPGKEPRLTEVENNLKTLKEIVGGYIEVVYPFEEPVGIVCNEEGKLLGLPLNRGLKDYDIIAGTFMVVGLSACDFCSLTPEQAEKYRQKFAAPELFMRMGQSVITRKGDSNDPEGWHEIFLPNGSCIVDSIFISDVYGKKGKCDNPNYLVKEIHLSVNKNYPKTVPRGGDGFGKVNHIIL
jgi:hypothetical protein